MKTRYTSLKMCLVAVGLYACGHGKVLVSHPATKKCNLAVHGLCVPENEIPNSDLVSEYIFIEGPTYNRTEKGSTDASIRTMCQRPNCDNFRPDIRCVELVVQLTRTRLENLWTSFTQLKQAYQSLDEAIARQHVKLWFVDEKHTEWEYQFSLTKIQEALENLEEYHELCSKHIGLGDAWDGRILNPSKPDSNPWIVKRPKYRCFPGKTFNKAACFIRKAHAKSDQLQKSLQELQALQKARNARLIEELFAEHDEMAGIDRHELAALRAERETLEAALVESVLSSPRDTVSAWMDNDSRALPYPAISDAIWKASAAIPDMSATISPLRVQYARLEADLIELEREYDEDEDDSQVASLAELNATSEPLFSFKDLPPPSKDLPIPCPATLTDEQPDWRADILKLLEDISDTLSDLAEQPQNRDEESAGPTKAECSCG